MTMRILVFGEVLWDVFGDKRVIGGAPFNFAAHCARLGAETYLVSAVGNDKAGADAANEIRAHGIDGRYTAVIDRPTGICEVTLTEGHPEYDLKSGTAYDYIPCPDTDVVFDALYFGSLALRGEESRRSLLELSAKASAAERFCDINVRQDFCTDEIISICLSNATVLKFSREEAGIFGCGSDHTLAAERILKDFPKIHTVLVTLDTDGAMAFTRSGRYYAPAERVTPVSSVGAGDSFSAAYLVNRLSGAEIGESLSRACALAGYVVTQLGAVPDYPAELINRIYPNGGK